MALTKHAIAVSYPLPAYSYKVAVGPVTMSFSEVSGLQVSYEKVIYKHGLSYLTGPNIIRAQQNEINLTLKRGVVADRRELFDWLEDKAKKDIMIDLCDEAGKTIVQWKVRRAMPLRMDAPSFNASGNEAALESLELIAQSLTIQYF